MAKDTRMSEVKRGRKPFPKEMKANTTSIRLTESQREMFKAIGGNQWLKSHLDDLFHIKKIAKDFVL